MKRLGLIILMAVLVACRPPVVDPVDPLPPGPEPVPGDYQVAGDWFGAMVSLDEGLIIDLELTLEEAGGLITGVAVFPFEADDVLGLVEGAVSGQVFLTVAARADGSTVIFVLRGDVVDGVFSGVVERMLDTTGSFEFGRTP